MKRHSSSPGAGVQLDMFEQLPPLHQALHQAESDSLLPKTAQMLVEVIGLDATIDLVKDDAGRDILVPSVVDGASVMWERLVEVIGYDAAEKLVRHCPGVRINIPFCAKALRALRNRNIIQRYDAGEPFESIRRSYRITSVHLYRLLKLPG